MGTSDSAIEKRCRICGIDVARQKRTKDSAGNYYCQPCYDAARIKTAAKPQMATVQVAEEPIRSAAAPALPMAAPELYPCPDCGGMFSVDQMDASGVCRECAGEKSQTASVSNPPPPQLKRYLKIAGITIGGVAVLATIVVFILARGFYGDLDSANDKIDAANDRLIEKAKQRAEAARHQSDVPAPNPTHVTAAPTHRPSRSQLVDDDATLSNIASRSGELDDALRGKCSARLANSYLRVAWTSETITYEEFQYAQKFRHDQGDYP